MKRSSCVVLAVWSIVMLFSANLRAAETQMDFKANIVAGSCEISVEDVDFGTVFYTKPKNVSQASYFGVVNGGTKNLTVGFKNCRGANSVNNSIRKPYLMFTPLNYTTIGASSYAIRGNNSTSQGLAFILRNLGVGSVWVELNRPVALLDGISDWDSLNQEKKVYEVAIVCHEKPLHTLTPNCSNVRSGSLVMDMEISFLYQ